MDCCPSWEMRAGYLLVDAEMLPKWVSLCVCVMSYFPCKTSRWEIFFPLMYWIWTGKSVFLYEYVCGISNQSNKCKCKHYTKDCTECYLKWKKHGCLQLKRRQLVKSVLAALTLVMSQNGTVWPLLCQLVDRAFGLCNAAVLFWSWISCIIHL